MTPLRIEGGDRLMKADASVPGNESVPDLICAFIDGCYVSRWEPTPEELEELNRGGSVELWCKEIQPIVALAVAPHAADGEEGEDSLEMT